MIWPDWTGRTAVCIATGPSLTPEHVARVKAASVATIGINDIGLTEPWIDLWYAADRRFWSHYRPARGTALRICAQPEALADGLVDGLLSVKDRDKALRYVPGYVVSGGHSGCQALQLAISLGAKRVVLLGYDGKARGPKTNYFGQKCAALQQQSHYEAWPDVYRKLAIPSAVEVINATPGSAIDAYPKTDLEAALHT